MKRFRSPPRTAARYAEVFAHMRRTIAQYGWMVQVVGADGDAPAFCYTVGVHQALGHPELFCQGLHVQVMHGILNDAAQRVKDTGEPLPLDEAFPDLLTVPVVFRRFRPDCLGEHTGIATAYYRGVLNRPPPPFLQLIYPDENGRFPWQAGVNPKLARQQPLYTRRGAPGGPA